jgi:hypothetical protein
MTSFDAVPLVFTESDAQRFPFLYAVTDIDRGKWIPWTTPELK